jgi:hypothetical protein
MPEPDEKTDADSTDTADACSTLGLRAVKLTDGDCDMTHVIQMLPTCT